MNIVGRLYFVYILSTCFRKFIFPQKYSSEQIFSNTLLFSKMNMVTEEHISYY